MRLFILLVIIAMSFSVSSQVKQSLSSDGMVSLSASSSHEPVLGRNNGMSGSEIMAYPSPFKTSFVIESSQQDEIKNVTIANILGKNVPVMIDLTGSKAFVTFDSGVPDGIYLCKITLDNKIKTIRMVRSSR